MKKPFLYKLKNNLPIVFIENKNISYVSIGFKVKAGSNYETPNDIGTAHLVEHLILSKDIELLQKYGGKVWGVTSRDDCYIYIKVLKEYIEEALKYLSKIITNDNYSEEDLNIQKEIIKHEIKRSLSNPEKIILRRSYRTMYPRTRMESLNTGEREDIDKVTLEMCNVFKEKHYTTTNAVLGIIGNIEKEELQILTQKYLGKLPKGRNIDIPILNQATDYRIETIKGNYNQIHIKIDYEGFTFNNKKRYALTLLTNIVDQYLNKKFRNEQHKAYVISAKDFYSQSFGTFSIYTATDTKDIIKEINDELLNVKNILQEIDLNVVKLNVISELVFSLENPSQLVDFYSTGYLTHNLVTIDQEIKNYKAVTENDIFNVYNHIVNQHQKITILEY